MITVKDHNKTKKEKLLFYLYNYSVWFHLIIFLLF